MMCGTVENQVLEWRATIAVCQNSGERRVLDACAQLFGGSSGMACSACYNYLETEVKLRYYKT